MTFKQLLAAMTLVCATVTGTTTTVLADVVATEVDGAPENVGPVVLYVTDIPEDDPDGGLIVRSGPSTRTARVDVLENGTAVTAVAWPVSGFFVEIIDPVAGWVGVKYLTVDKPEQPIRQIDAQNARPAVDNPDDGPNDSEIAPETLALDDEADEADGGISLEEFENVDKGSGFPLPSVGIALVLLGAMGGVLVFRRRRAEETSVAADNNEPVDGGEENNSDARVEELAARAAKVRGNR